MKFYLVNLHFSDLYSEKITTPPLGAGYIMAALDKGGIESRYYEFSFHNNLTHLLEDIKKFAPALIGFSLRSHRYQESYKIINQVAKMNIPIVLGGAHVNCHGGKVLEECSADFLIQKEGEEALLLLLAYLGEKDKYAEIPGLIYRQDGKIRENQPQILDITKLVFPTYKGFELEKYPASLRLLLSSRGCPYHCTFCQQSALLGKKWRQREPEDILREMEYWAERKVKFFNFADDNLTLDGRRIRQLCRLIKKSRYRFYLETSGMRIDNVDYETLKMMKDSGFYYLSFGIESGNDRVLGEINKGITVKQVNQTLSWAWKLGFDMKLYFIVNNRTETYEEVQDSFRLARAYPIMLARFTNLVPYPGTYDYEWILQHGRLLYPASEYLNNAVKYWDQPLYEGPGMTYEQRVQVIHEGKEEVKKLQQKTWKGRIKKVLGLIKNGNFQVVGRKIAWTTKAHFS